MASQLSRRKKLGEPNAEILDRPGVYLFYQSIDGDVVYVGRSDTSLSVRLQARKETGFIKFLQGTEQRYYQYKNLNDPKEAYIWECKYYHKYNPVLNVRHPAKPEGSNVKCPISSCPLSK